MTQLKTSIVLAQSKFKPQPQQQLKNSRYYKVNFMNSNKTIQSSPIYEKYEKQTLQANQNKKSAQMIQSVPVYEQQSVPIIQIKPNNGFNNKTYTIVSPETSSLGFSNYQGLKFTYSSPENIQNPPVSLNQIPAQQNKDKTLQGMTVPQLHPISSISQSQPKTQQPTAQPTGFKWKSCLIWTLVSLIALGIIIAAFIVLFEKFHHPNEQKRPQIIIIKQPDALPNPKPIYFQPQKFDTNKAQNKTEIKTQQALPKKQQVIVTSPPSSKTIYINPPKYSNIESVQKFYQTDHTNYKFLTLRKPANNQNTKNH